ncbi:MAG: hypothetical protein ONB42_02160, partial [candidate division KSB1 bacterium]|nr:hypothetical protein [candidate division KSB1 bacterium]
MIEAIFTLKTGSTQVRRKDFLENLRAENFCGVNDHEESIGFPQRHAVHFCRPTLVLSSRF